MTGKKLLKDEDVPADVVPTSIDYEVGIVEESEDSGKYRTRIEWTDGHSGSIYPFDKMDELCKEFKRLALVLVGNCCKPF